jgi:ABC-2 type transport system ATP-binding protein
VPARPVVEARQLGLRLPGGWTYRGVDLVVLPGELVVLLGPEQGSRTQLLLTLATQLTPTEGTLDVCGYPVQAEADRARARLTLAEPAARSGESNRVEDAVRTRLLLSDLSPESDLFDAAADLLGLAVARDDVIAELPALSQHLLTVALAAIVPAQLILIDDVDRDLGPVDRQTLWRALGSLVRTGPAVVAGSSMATAQADQVLTVPSGTSKFIP